MQMTLKAKNKIGFINSLIVRPNASDPSYEIWKRFNNMVSSWIINSVAKEIGESIICARTTAKMWQDLKSRFTQANGPRIFQLQRNLSTLMQEDMSVSDYYTKFKCLWDELLEFNQIPMCSCGALHNCSCGAF